MCHYYCYYVVVKASKSTTKHNERDEVLTDHVFQWTNVVVHGRRDCSCFSDEGVLKWLSQSPASNKVYVAVKNKLFM